MIKKYDDRYLISESGEIVNIKTGKIKKPTIGNHGYLSVDLYKNNQRETYLIHRLVANTYLPNPENKRTVNHKDGNKLNNHIDNLEWATYSENHLHSYQKLNRKAAMSGRLGKLNPHSKSILMYSKTGELVAQYDSIMDAERDLNIRNNSIIACLKGYHKTSGGYRWEYAK